MYRCKTTRISDKDFKYNVKLLKSNDNGKTFEETGIEQQFKTKIDCVHYIQQCMKQYGDKV